MKKGESMRNKIINKIIKWSRRSSTAKQRLLFLMPESIIFLFLIPYAIFLLSKLIDNFLHLPSFSSGILTMFLGTALGAFGLLFGMWSVVIQFTEGKGTPVPFMATQKLITHGPNSYCRNPMAFGTFIYYLGIGIILGSLSFIALTFLVVMVVLLLYIKKIEEKELEERFGEKYAKYKLCTPFFIPKILKKRR